MTTNHSISISASVDVSVDQLWPLLADVRRWPRWGPFTSVAGGSRADASQAIRVGRRIVHLHVTSPDAPYWVRYQASVGRGYTHTAEVTLSPTEDGGSDVTWRGRLNRGLPGTLGLRRARLAAEVTRLLAALASYAEDAPATRLEWAEWAQAAGAPRKEPALAA